MMMGGDAAPYDDDRRWWCTWRFEWARKQFTKS